MSATCNIKTAINTLADIVRLHEGNKCKSINALIDLQVPAALSELAKLRQQRGDLLEAMDALKDPSSPSWVYSIASLAIEKNTGDAQ